MPVHYTQEVLTEALVLFRKNGFVSIDHLQRNSFGSAYYQIYSADLPVLITTDSVLNALHNSFDELLQDLETYVISPALADVLSACHESLTKSPPHEGLADNGRTAGRLRRVHR